MNAAAVGLIAIWFAAALVASLSGVIDKVPSSILLSASFVLAVAAFAALYFAVPVFRSFVLTRPTRFLLLAESPRISGVVFLIGYAQGVLPALYAFVTGISDISIGFTALALARSQVSDPPGRRVLYWHCAGILGLIISGGAGILTSPSIRGSAPGQVTSQTMCAFPWNLVPLFLGPLMLWFHLMAFSKYRNCVAGVTKLARPLSNPRGGLRRVQPGGER